jgi:DNA-binding CsgD family transcriptional regulator
MKKLDKSALTKREIQVFNLTGQGLRKTAMAKKLGISINTIETHRAKLKKKLKLKTAFALLKASILDSIK